MINLFEKLNTISRNLNNPNKNYWEENTIEWDRNAKMPNGDTFNEKQMFESIRQSDIKRLLKYQ